MTDEIKEFDRSTFLKEMWTFPEADLCLRKYAGCMNIEEKYELIAIPILKKWNKVRYNWLDPLLALEKVLQKEDKHITAEMIACVYTENEAKILYELLQEKITKVK